MPAAWANAVGELARQSPIAVVQTAMRTPPSLEVEDVLGVAIASFMFSSEPNIWRVAAASKPCALDWSVPYQGAEKTEPGEVDRSFRSGDVRAFRGIGLRGSSFDQAG
jgi:hypothetical protein